MTEKQANEPGSDGLVAKLGAIAVVVVLSGIGVWSSIKPIKTISATELEQVCDAYAEKWNDIYREQGTVAVAQCLPGKSVAIYDPISGKILKEVSWTEFAEAALETKYSTE